MARLEITGIDGLMARFNGAASELRPIVEEALRESGEALAEEILKQEKRFKEPTGELGRSLVITPPWHRGNASGVFLNYEGMYVGARGGGEAAGGHTRRAAFVAAMQEYKNKRPFNKRARNKAAPRINSIIIEAVGHVNKSLTGDWGGL